jgi:hypothetical protein
LSAREILSYIESVASNAALFDENNFLGRAEAIDFLEFNVLVRLGGLRPEAMPEAEAAELRGRAAGILERLDALDKSLFERLRGELRDSADTGKDLMRMIDAHAGGLPSDRGGENEAGYDCLDLFLNGLLSYLPVPEETRTREADMVYFQKTPVRIILEMIGKARLGEGDVFFDLGSGLGQIPILVNLLTGADAKGIEFEPAYCEHAKRYAEELRLPRVEFIQGDARDADYTAGTVFFLYTPFEGGILESVLERLRTEAGWDIRVFTYGPCTATVAEAGWLKPSGGKVAGTYELGLFERVA